MTGIVLDPSAFDPKLRIPGVENSLNTSLGATSQTSFDAGALIYDQITANLDFVRSYDLDAFAGPLSVAFGAEYRLEGYEIQAGEEASYITGQVISVDGGMAI